MRRRRSKSQEKSRSATNESTSSYGDKEEASTPAKTAIGGEPNAEQSSATEDSIPVPESDSIPQADTTTMNAAQNSNTEDAIPVPQGSNSIPEAEAIAGDKPADGSTSEGNKSDTKDAPSGETNTDLPAETTENKESIPNPQDPIPTDSTNTTNEHQTEGAKEPVEDSEPTKNEPIAES